MAKPTDPRIKAAAIADLATGMGPVEVADKHGIPLETVKSWRKRGVVPRPVQPAYRGDLLAADASEMHPDAPPMHPVKKDLGEQLYDYLSESIVTLQSQIVFIRDTSWLTRQNAADVAILIGVVSDKTTELLAALQPAQSDSSRNDS